jgi:sec-independent protein translocase protein TatA
MFGNIGTPEILLIVLVILVLFGANKIPDFAKGLGKGMKEFKKALKEVEEDINLEEDTSKTQEKKEEKK